MLSEDLREYLIELGFTFNEGIFSRDIGDLGKVITLRVGYSSVLFKFEYSDITVLKKRRIPSSREGLLNDVSSFVFLIYKMGGDNYGNGTVED